MRFLAIVAIACIFVAVSARSIKAMPVVWYGIALAIDAVYAYGIVYGLPPAVLQVLSVVIQRGLFATALFTIVMHCGALPARSVIRNEVGSIRAELSIISCILAFAHCLNYLNSYLATFTENIGVVAGNQLASLFVAIVLFALLLVLGMTSAKALKSRIKAATWKTVQRGSHIFSR